MIPYCAISNSLRKSKSCLPFFFLLFLLLGSSCKGKNREENESDDSIEKVSLKVKYAQFFSIDNLPLGHRIKIYNPSNGALLQSLVLIPSKEAKTFTPQEGEEVIAVPCKRLALLSDTFVGAIELLDARERLLGTADVSTLYDAELQKRAKEGKLHSFARSGITDVESLIASQVDGAMANYYDGVEHSMPLPKESPTKLIYNNDWQESSLLARAEWIKVIALLVGKGATADSIFSEMERKYNLLKEKAQTCQEKPTIFFGNAYQGVWHLPANDSYVAKMIADAGGIYNAPTSAASQAGISFEAVLQQHINDDIWLAWQSGDIHSLEDFASQEGRYALFRAYQKGQVYLNDARKSAKGNDYFESGPYQPETILADLITIFHPELSAEHTDLVFWRKLLPANQPKK